MADALLTYDITKRHSAVKAELKKKGYLDYWTANNKTYYLPNTTMWKKGGDSSTALKDMQAVISILNHNQYLSNKISLDRCIAVDFSYWNGIPGQPHRS